jgi:hypothetical protein
VLGPSGNRKTFDIVLSSLSSEKKIKMRGKYFPLHMEKEGGGVGDI